MRGRMAAARTGRATTNAVAATATLRCIFIITARLAERTPGVNHFPGSPPFLSPITRPMPPSSPLRGAQRGVPRRLDGLTIALADGHLIDGRRDLVERQMVAARRVLDVEEAAFDAGDCAGRGDHVVVERAGGGADRRAV